MVRRNARAGNPPIRLEGTEDALWRFACPACRTALTLHETIAQCTGCDRSYRREHGIWRFLSEDRLRYYDRFLHEYHSVRSNQGWGATRPEYFRALPRVGHNDPQREIWQLRVNSYRTLRHRVVMPREAHVRQPLAIVDAGAGNCWLSYRLAERGHKLAAIDLSTDDLDGLGAHTWYANTALTAHGGTVTPIQAEFDSLPLASGATDVLIFNASLHYSTDYTRTLTEALRVLRSDGEIVIMDSPTYRDPASGTSMVREREEEFERRYGFRSDSLPSEHFLTFDRLAELEQALDLRWRVIALPRGLSTRLRRLRVRLRARREPATMPLIVGTRA